MILGTWFGAGWAGYQCGPVGGRARRRRRSARSAGCCTRSPPSPSASTTSSPVSPSTSSALGRHAVPRPRSLFEGTPGGGDSQSPPHAGDRHGHRSPASSDPLRRLQNKHWFLVSDVAGVLRGLHHRRVAAHDRRGRCCCRSPTSCCGAPPFGLRLRSCGESPSAAESLGVNVYLMKYFAVIASGAFAGLGGAFLAIVAGNVYREGQTGGRGYIGLAAMIFGNWRPGGLAAGAGAVRLHRRAAAAQRRRVRARAAAARRDRCCSLLAVWLALRRQAVAGGRSSRSSSAPSSCGTCTDRRRCRASSPRRRRTSPRCWCSRWPRSGCGCPRPTGMPYRRGRGAG